MRSRGGLFVVVLLALTGCAPGHAVPLAPPLRLALHHVKAHHQPPWTFRASDLPTAFPHDVVPRADHPCALTPLRPGWVKRENQRPGTRSWFPGRDLSSAAVYVDDPSLACGDTLSVRLGGAGGPGERVRVLRIGWYGGAGARTVWTSGALTVPLQPEPHVRDHVVPGAGWQTRLAVVVQRSWPPGLYLAEALRDTHAVGVAAFVVRNDALPSPLVAVHSNLTWAAYSSAGGASLYRSASTRGLDHAQFEARRAYQVSLLRPTVDGGWTHLYGDDVPLAQLTDELGLPVDHVMDTDLEVRPSVLLGHAGIVLPGHSEYWTARGYQALIAERNRGVNLADLGANSVYWHARVASDARGEPLTMTTYRYAALDPETRTHPLRATVRWEDPPLNRPASAVVGQGYAAALVRGGLVLHRPPPWLVRGTRLHDGSPLPGAVLNEADGAQAGDPAAPPDVQVVTEGVLLGRSDRVVSSSYYSDVSGAGVFAAGTTSWLCDLRSTCPEAPAPPATASALRALTANVLRAFSNPRWGATHPSSRDVPRSPEALLPSLPAEAVGTIGVRRRGQGPLD